MPFAAYSGEVGHRFRWMWTGVGRALRCSLDVNHADPLLTDWPSVLEPLKGPVAATSLKSLVCGVADWKCGKPNKAYGTEMLIEQGQDLAVPRVMV